MKFEIGVLVLASRGDSKLLGLDGIPTPITKAHRRCAVMFLEGDLKPGSFETVSLEEFELVGAVR